MLSLGSGLRSLSVKLFYFLLTLQPLSFLLCLYFKILRNTLLYLSGVFLVFYCKKTCDQIKNVYHALYRPSTSSDTFHFAAIYSSNISYCYPVKRGTASLFSHKFTTLEPYFMCQRPGLKLSWYFFVHFTCDKIRYFLDWSF